MYTGYFGKMKSYPKNLGLKYVSIARFNKFWQGDVYLKLAPPKEIIHLEDERLYEKNYYEKVLSRLNPKEVFDELGENAVLLCYEKFEDCKMKKTFCHRHIVAKWLKKNLNIEVKELLYEDESDNKQLYF